MSAPVLRQLLVLMDAEQPATPVEEVRMHLLDIDEPVSPLRLAGVEVDTIGADQPPDWAMLSAAVADLAQRVRAAAQHAQQTEMVVCGQAPLPLFLQLGQELADWDGPISFLERRPHTWDAIALSPLPPDDGQKLFAVTGLDEVPALVGGRAAVLVSTRGNGDQERERVQALLAQRGEAPGALVEVRTKRFWTLQGPQVAQATRSLQAVFGAIGASGAGQTPLVVVHGSPALAFLVGRALGRKPALVATSDNGVLRLPFVPAPRDPLRIQVFIAHDDPRPDEPRLHEELARHLRACRLPAGMALQVTDKGSVRAGENQAEALATLIAESDILVPLLSPGLLEDKLGKKVWSAAGRGIPVVPVLARRFDVEHSDWGGSLLLPRDRVPLLSSRSLDDALTEVAEGIRERAEQIASERSSLALRAGRRSGRGAEDGGGADLQQVLMAIERDLQAEPLLRFTKERRYRIWLRVVDWLDRTHPEKKLRALLAAPTQEHFDELRAFAPNTQAPEVFLPSETQAPLQEVLALLGEAAAAWWLLLGVVYVSPRVSFPEYSALHHEVDLVGPLLPHLPRLLSRYPAADRQVDLAVRLHEERCSGLMTSVAAQSPGSTGELELALEILNHWRKHAALRKDLPEPATLQSPGVLNLLGALALWRGDIAMAESAYREARDRAYVDRDAVAEWVAVQGLRFVNLSRNWDAAEQEAELLWRQQEQLAAKSGRVKQIVEQGELVLSKAQREMAGELCDTLANERWSEAPAFGVNDADLDGLHLDQEELGLPLALCADAAELLGTIRLLQGPVADDRLAQTVALLCRYGSSGLGGRFKELRFYSPALHPGHPEFAAVCAQVLAPGRCAGEWFAKLGFLKRHELDLPLSLINAAGTFYQQSLDGLLHHAPRTSNGWIIRQLGSSVGSEAEDAVGNAVLDHQVRVAAYIPEGLTWLRDMLDRSEPTCWLRALERLRRFPWETRRRLDSLDQEGLTALGTRLVGRLDEAQSQQLFVEGARPGRTEAIRADLVPEGLAGILSVMRETGVAVALVQELHLRLCRMLRAHLHAKSSRWEHQRAFFSKPVFGWLCAQVETDEESEALVREQLDLLLADLEQSRAKRRYAEGYALLALPVLQKLSPAQRDRLARILDQQLDALAEAAAAHGPAPGPLALLEASRPLAFFAASALEHDDPKLWEPARSLLRCCPAQPSMLPVILRAPPQRLGGLLPVLEQAALHCLSGLSSQPIPWWGESEVLDPQPGRFTEESLLTDGLEAVKTVVSSWWREEPPAGWAAWLDPVLAHCYHKSHAVAAAALSTLNLALVRIPEVVDQRRAAHALSWALAQPERQTRDAALDAAVRHQARLAHGPAGVRLAKALQRHDPPQTISAACIKRVAGLPFRS